MHYDVEKNVMRHDDQFIFIWWYFTFSVH